VLQRLKDAAEKAKHELSSTAQTEVNIPFLTADAAGPKHFALTFTRAKLESLVKELIDRSITLTRQAVKDAGLQLSEIHEVVMVGGQTRMPAIVEAVKALFGREPHRDINPDEVVAIGAAIQGAVMSGDVRDVLLLDVTPLTLAIETLGGVATPMIEKNTTVPTSKSNVFSTAADNQPSVEIHITQGERQFSKDNKALGRFILDGIPPAPRGVPQVEVSFDIDANGILSVKAKDKGTGKEQSIRIEGSSGLTKEEKERMVREASEHADEDRAKKEEIDQRNTAETLVYTTEKMLHDNKDRVKDEDKKNLEEKCAAVTEALKGTDMAVVKAKAEELGEAAQKVGAAMYQQQESQKAGEQESQKAGEQESQKAGEQESQKAEEVKTEEEAR
jgi:molecular chaperone DnaK